MSGSGTEVGGVTLSLTVTKITLTGRLASEFDSPFPKIYLLKYILFQILR